MQVAESPAPSFTITTPVQKTMTAVAKKAICLNTVFKKQAPEYESEIAAIVFEQLAFNPADKMSDMAKKEAESPSKLMDLFQRLVAKGMGKLDD